jgi:hypothetical protein
VNGAHPTDAGTSSQQGGEQGEPAAEVVPAAAADQAQSASMLDGRAEAAVASASAAMPQPPRKGPLSFLSGALTSGLLAWLCLGLSQKVVGYYALHPPHYEARVAQSIATALKTMIVGMSFLATFSFAFVGLGLVLVFLRSLLPARPETPA